MLLKSERSVEKRLISAVRTRGGLALKFVSPGMAGVPDRILLLPGGVVAFVEVKAPGEGLRPQQEKRKMQIEELGFYVYVLDDARRIGGMLDQICAARIPKVR